MDNMTKYILVCVFSVHSVYSNVCVAVSLPVYVARPVTPLSDKHRYVTQQMRCG